MLRALKIAAIRVEATTSHHHLRSGKIYLFSSIDYSMPSKSCCKFFQSSYHLISLAMPFCVNAASLGLGFCEYAETNLRQILLQTSLPGGSVGYTRHNLGKHAFSMGCIFAVLGGPGTTVMTEQPEFCNRKWETLTQTNRRISGPV